MKRLVLFSFLALPFILQAQNPFPGNSRKLWLGYQTSAEGLIYYSSGAPAYTPGFLTGPFHYMDTTNNVFYQYDRVNIEWDTIHGNYTFPSAAPSAGDILRDTDGDGAFEFVTASSIGDGNGIYDADGETGLGYRTVTWGTAPSSSFMVGGEDYFEVYIADAAEIDYADFQLNMLDANLPKIQLESQGSAGGSFNIFYIDTSAIRFHGKRNGATYSFYLPGESPASGEVLGDSDGDGNLEWVSSAGDGNIYDNDGTLAGDRIVTGNGNRLTFNNNLATSSSFNFSNANTGATLFSSNSSSGVAIQGQGSSGTGGFFTSTSGISLRGTSTSGIGAQISSTSNIPIRAIANPSSTNTAIEILNLRRTSSGTAAAGIGSYIKYSSQDDVGSIDEQGRLQMTFTDVGDGNESSKFHLLLRNGGSAAAEVLNVLGTGAVQYNNYGSGTFTGTEAFNITEDASGNIIETPIGTGAQKDTLAFTAETSTDPTTIAFGNWYFIDVSGGTVELDLPAGTPVPGDTFKVTDSRANAGTNNITIDFITAGDNVHGASTNYIINANQRTVTFVYRNAAIGWVAEL